MRRLFKKACVILILLVVCVSCDRSSPPAAKGSVEAPKPFAQGVWVTVFCKEKVLYSPAAVDKLMKFCKKNGISDIYLQVLRSGEAYYDSPILGRSKYEQMVKEFGGDPIERILREAKNNRIRVYAWINVLSLAQNKGAPIIVKYGKSVLTRDKSLRASIRGEDINDSDTYYLRDDQLFLEPGDERVVEFLTQIVEEIAVRYPGFDGMHLDYIRYPYPVPFVPDSRFMDYGVTYGFGERNLARFKEATGLNPRKDNPFMKDLAFKWDQWKRAQVTMLAQRLATAARSRAGGWRISCAAVPTPERAYAIAFQDWPQWLEQGLIDHAVLMNYTRDERFFTDSIKSVLGFVPREKVHVGIGAFLFKERKELLRRYEQAKALKPGGIVFFSYDDLLDLSAEAVLGPAPAARESDNHLLKPKE